MTDLSRRFLVAAASAALSLPAVAQPADEPLKIMERYAAALDANNVEALVALYTDNGVYMRPDMPAVAGRAALRQAYKEVFATLKLKLAFEVHEVEILGDMAWLRATSLGRVKILATGVETSDTYHELVVFRREGGAWKIRSYIYAPDKPSTSSKT
jgi:uncharacterized protein (TIGR02246 family)